MRRIFQALSIGVITLGLAACGAGGGPGPGRIASLGGATTTTKLTGGTSRGGGSSGEDNFYAFAKCIRDKGIDFPDPHAGGGPVRISPDVRDGQPSGSGPDPSDPKFQEAEKACAKELGDIGPGSMDPARRQEFQDQALAFARCMRENGVDLPDPSFGEGGTMEQRLEGGVSPDGPKFQDASKKCEPLLGRGGVLFESGPKS